MDPIRRNASDRENPAKYKLLFVGITLDRKNPT
jgi:hypothetical protein